MQKLTHYTTLTFDCYGTLVDWERGILEELRPFAARHGIAASDQALLEAFGETESRCEKETPSKLYPALLADVLRHLGERWKVTVSADEAAHFGGSVGRWPVFADSPAALQYLKRYFKLVIISNVDRASFAKSNEKLGVDFDRIVTAEDVGTYKPNPRNFDYALRDLEQALGVGKSAIMHVAQSLFHDMVPAKAAGLATTWIDRRRGVGGWGATPPPPGGVDAARPDYEASSLADFVALHQAHLREGKE